MNLAALARGCYSPRMENLPIILGVCAILELGGLGWLLVSLLKEVAALRQEQRKVQQPIWASIEAQISEIRKATPAIGEATIAMSRRMDAIHGELVQCFEAVRGDLDRHHSEVSIRDAELLKRLDSAFQLLRQSISDIVQAFHKNVSADLISATEKSADGGQKLREAIEAKLEEVRGEVEKLRQDIRETVSFTS